MVGFNFADLKRTVRQAVHDTFAVPAFYSDSAVTAVPVNVRWHNKLVRAGNLDAAGYAEIFEGVNKVVFGDAELVTLGLTPRQQGVLTFPDYAPMTLVLDTLEPREGPVDVVWNVSRGDIPA